MVWTIEKTLPGIEPLGAISVKDLARPDRVNCYPGWEHAGKGQF